VQRRGKIWCFPRCRCEGWDRRFGRQRCRRNKFLPVPWHPEGDGGAVVVFLGHLQGEQLARLVENGTKVAVTITRGQDVKFRFNNINRTSVLFVSVSFIILMVISLAWLIFYYIQRFRYIHAKDKLARHLCNAAKKALSKIPVKHLKPGDKEVVSENECCAVCIESYQVSDNLRVLPCKHQFHKVCVDPWLLEHRTCPMCKMDILKYYGFVLSGSEESIVQIDVSEEAPAREVEATPAIPTSSSNNDNNTSNIHDASTTSNDNVEVVVFPQEELRGAEATVCEGWTDSPVPDTPISPVHQSIVTPPSTTTSASVLSSMIGSARALASQAARVSQSSHVSSTVAPLKLDKCSTPLPPIKDVCCEKDTSGAVATEPSQDLEVASVCSQDFSDKSSLQSDVEAAIDEVLRSTEDLGNINTLQSNILIVTNEAGSPVNSESTDLATRCSPLLKCAGDSERGSRSPARRSASISHSRRSASHSRRRSASRSRSRKRSTSQERSSSRGRSAGMLGSPSHRQTTSRAESRPSSHVVSVSHF
ncbi:unnamed protein product, partial [Meganyctiphanes norvegica]